MDFPLGVSLSILSLDVGEMGDTGGSADLGGKGTFAVVGEPTSSSSSSQLKSSSLSEVPISCLGVRTK